MQPFAAHFQVIGSLTVQRLSTSLPFINPEHVNWAFRLQTPLAHCVSCPFCNSPTFLWSYSIEFSTMLGFLSSVSILGSFVDISTLKGSFHLLSTSPQNSCYLPDLTSWYSSKVPCTLGTSILLFFSHYKHIDIMRTWHLLFPFGL